MPAYLSVDSMEEVSRAKDSPGGIGTLESTILIWAATRHQARLANYESQLYREQMGQVTVPYRLGYLEPTNYILRDFIHEQLVASSI